MAQAKAEKAYRKAQRPLYKKKRVIFPAAFLALIIVIVAANSGGGKDAPSLVQAPAAAPAAPPAQHLQRRRPPPRPLPLASPMWQSLHVRRMSSATPRPVFGSRTVAARQATTW